MAETRRLSNVANTRVLAIFLVVLGHSIIIYSDAWTLYETVREVSFLNELKKVVDFLQMYLFFFLAGYLFFFTHGKHRGFLRLASDKARRLLLPYLGIALLYLLPIRLLVGFWDYRSMNAFDLLQKLATTGDVGHLWFLPAIFLTFMLSEVILGIFERLPLCKKSPAICFGVASFLFYLEGYRIGFGYAPLLNAFHYMLYFAGGYFVCSQKAFFEKLYAVRPLKLCMLAVNIIAAVIFVASERSSVAFELLLKVLSILNIFKLMPNKSCSFLEKTDQNSFGIYLFHSPLVYITYSIIPNASPIIVVFVNLIVFGSVAYLLTDLVRRTKLKFLIGE